MEKELKQKYSVDANAIKEYFPLQTVLDGMFDIVSANVDEVEPFVSNQTSW